MLSLWDQWRSFFFKLVINVNLLSIIYFFLFCGPYLQYSTNSVCSVHLIYREITEIKGYISKYNFVNLRLSEKQEIQNPDKTEQGHVSDI